MSDEEAPDAPQPPRSWTQRLRGNTKHPLTVAVIGAVIAGIFSVYAAQASNPPPTPGVVAPTTSGKPSPSSTVLASPAPTTSEPDGSGGLEAPAPEPTRTLPPDTTIPQPPPTSRPPSTSDPWTTWCRLWVGMGRKHGVFVDNVRLDDRHVTFQAQVNFLTETVARRDELLSKTPGSLRGDMATNLAWSDRLLDWVREHGAAARPPAGSAAAPTQAEADASERIIAAEQHHCGLVPQ